MITLLLEPTFSEIAPLFETQINNPYIDMQKLINQLSQARKDTKRSNKDQQEVNYNLGVYDKWTKYIKALPGCANLLSESNYQGTMIN